MSRSLPTSVDIRHCETQVAIRIKLHDGSIVRIASGSLSFVEEDSGLYVYEGKINKDSDLNASITQSADTMSVDASNIDKALGLTINDEDTILLGAKVTCCKVFRPLTGGTYESKVLMEGEVAEAPVTEEAISLKIISDIAPNLAFISARPIQFKCPLVFKSKACGYVGVLTTCNKEYESVDGCFGRDNQPRFGGLVKKGDLAEPINGSIDTHVSDGSRGTGGDSGDGSGDVKLPSDIWPFWWKLAN